MALAGCRVIGELSGVLSNAGVAWRTVADGQRRAPFCKLGAVRRELGETTIERVAAERVHFAFDRALARPRFEARIGLHTDDA